VIRKVIIIYFVLSLISCKKEKKTLTYTPHPAGYFFRLFSFTETKPDIKQGMFVKLNITFRTQSDSVFWDSFNNFNDHFYVEADSISPNSKIQSHISGASVGDSLELLIPVGVFFSEIYNTNLIPFFSQKDTVVKVNFKIEQAVSEAAYMASHDELRINEQKQIERFFGTRPEFEAALDPSGFFWVQRPAPTNTSIIKEGQEIQIIYTAKFLNGRFLDKTVKKFEFVYGTPDQVLKGLNYVIGRLKLGQTAKIILPSRLAFGENGSTNGTVPPFTPLLYEIKVL